MNRKLVAFLSILILSACIPLIPATAAVKAGAKCTKVSSKSVIGSKIYTCIKSGKRLVWNQGSKISSPISVQVSHINDEIKLGMQSILIDLDFSSINSNVVPNYIVEPGKNGVYEPIIRKDFINSVNALLLLSGKNPYSKVNVLIGRSQSWLKKEITVNCTGDEFTGNVIAAFAMSPCTGSGLQDGALIAINLPGVVTNKFLEADPLVDLSEFKVNMNVMQKVKNLAPHEYYHLWQSSLWPLQTEVPSWFREGSAQVFSLLVRAKSDNRSDSYSAVFNEWFSKDEILGSQSICKSSIAKVDYSMTTQCQYTQGIIPVEILLVKYGGISSLRKLNELVATMPFDQALSEITKKPISNFYAEVDSYAKTLGWTSK